MLPNSLILLVGAAGFEPATSCSQSKRATKLRYAPKENLPSVFEGFCQYERPHFHFAAGHEADDKPALSGKCLRFAGSGSSGLALLW